MDKFQVNMRAARRGRLPGVLSTGVENLPENIPESEAVSSTCEAVVGHEPIWGWRAESFWLFAVELAERVDAVNRLLRVRGSATVVPDRLEERRGGQGAMSGLVQVLVDAVEACGVQTHAYRSFSPLPQVLWSRSCPAN